MYIYYITYIHTHICIYIHIYSHTHMHIYYINYTHTHTHKKHLRPRTSGPENYHKITLSICALALVIASPSPTLILCSSWSQFAHNTIITPLQHTTGTLLPLILVIVCVHLPFLTYSCCSRSPPGPFCASQHQPVQQRLCRQGKPGR